MEDTINHTPVKHGNKSELKKAMIIGGFFAVLAIAGISVTLLRSPQTRLTEAQVDTRNQQCIDDGGTVTDQASCTNDGGTVIDYIGDISGDSSSIQVCCKPKQTVVRSCPNDAIEAQRNQCDGVIVQPISSDGTTVDGDEIRPGIICCKPKLDEPTPTTPEGEPTPTIPDPTPTACIDYDPPVIKSISIDCPNCNNVTE